MSVLMYGCQQGRNAFVNELLKYDEIDVNHQDRACRTALMITIQERNGELSMALLDRKEIDLTLTDVRDVNTIWKDRRDSCLSKDYDGVNIGTISLSRKLDCSLPSINDKAAQLYNTSWYLVWAFCGAQSCTLERMVRSYYPRRYHMLVWQTLFVPSFRNSGWSR